MCALIVLNYSKYYVPKKINVDQNLGVHTFKKQGTPLLSDTELPDSKSRCYGYWLVVGSAYLDIRESPVLPIYVDDDTKIEKSGGKYIRM